MDTHRGIQVERRVAVIPCSGQAGGFAAMAKLMDELRYEGVRAIALETRAMEGEPWDPVDAALLANAVLPVVAAWTGVPAPAAIAAGLYSDIRAGDSSLRLTGLQELPSPADARLGLLLGRETARDEMAADEAFAAGLVTDLASERGGALAIATRIAEAIAERGPIGTQLAKEALWRGLVIPIEQALRFETDLTLLVQTTNDRAEGVRAFLEKRAPEFKGD